ncbi:virulence factor TspB C-terminal domain-related protein [Chromobacterium haemolyticum]|uniref:virulence factor TspB C-terminal domain-related protein n=1 Tax=Chromobacterium haemolyticum TaxID=394935 RepID=UPI001374BA94|nr:virulence factor TspB C-terminal domain-related protein [Chromobacterium haemolyticum]
MRHIRNLLFFIIGAAISFVSLYSFAGVVTPVDDGYIYENGRLKPAPGYRVPAGSTIVTTPANDPYLKMTRSVGVVLKDMEGHAANATVKDLIRVNRAVAIGNIVSIMRGGLYQAAASFATDYLIGKGWEWMSDAQYWAKKTDPDVTKAMADLSFDPNGYCRAQGYSGYTGVHIAIGATPEGGKAPYLYCACKDGPEYRFGPLADSYSPEGKVKVNDAEVADAGYELVNSNQQGTVDFLQQLKSLPYESSTPTLDAPLSVDSEPYAHPDGASKTRFTLTPDATGAVSVGVTRVPASSPNPNPDPTKPDPKPDPESKDPCQTNPNRISCSEYGDIPEGEMPSQQQGSDFKVFSLSFSHSCPAPRAYRAGGNVYYSDWTQMCNFAEKIKPIIILAASIVSVLIISFGVKS